MGNIMANITYQEQFAILNALDAHAETLRVRILRLEFHHTPTYDPYYREISNMRDELKHTQSARRKVAKWDTYDPEEDE